jgi:ADP-ribose pyrophosphatase YjhB (NUDIX family)
VKGKRVAVALIRDDQDNVLFGLRNDCGKYTNPGGHLEGDEDAYQGVIREVKEETGLDVIALQLIKVGYRPEKKLMVYVFEVKVDPSQKVDPSNDPDKECDIWAYLDPNDVLDQLHVPVENNFLLECWAKS